MEKNSRRCARLAGDASDSDPAEEYIGLGELGESPELPAPENRSADFAGRGPKFYRRPDTRIIEDICERLTRHPSVDASNIEVLSLEGEVTLEGSVGTAEEKHWAQNIAIDVYGVYQVHNQLRVASARDQCDEAA